MGSPSSSGDRDPLERLAAEFLDRRRRGEHPSPSEYAERYPELAEQILEFFPALEVMEGLKPGSGRADRLARRASPTLPPLPRWSGWASIASSARSATAAWAWSTRPSRSRWAAAWP